MTGDTDFEALFNVIQDRDVSTLLGLEGLHKQLVQVDRLLYSTSIDQSQPASNECWGDSPGYSGPLRHRNGRLKGPIPIINSLVNRRKALWKEYGKLALPHLRPINLLDLLEDGNWVIRDIIFSYIAPDYGKFDASIAKSRQSENRTIKSLRRTCRALGQVAGPFLARNVSIRMNSESLDRFRRILSHPEIGPGVKCVRLLLPFYAKELADDFLTFASCQFRRQKRFVQEVLDSDGAWNNLKLEHDPDEKAAAESMLYNMDRICQGRTDETFAEQRNFLLAAWHHYKDAYIEQKNFRKLVAELARVIAKRPSTRVEIYDTLLSSVPNHPEEMEDVMDDKQFFARMMMPLSWEDYIGHLDGRNQVTGDTVDVMRDFLVALGREGAKPSRLHVQISIPKDYTRLYCDPEGATHLKRLAEELKRLSFWGGLNTTRKQKRAKRDAEGLTSLLHPLLSSNQLREVDLMLDCVRVTDRVRRRHVNSFIRPGSLDRLNRLSIKISLIHVPDLIAFLDGRGLCLELLDVQVMAGTWRELLDAMRDMSDDRRPAASRLTLETLKHPEGGEYRHMDPSSREEVFAVDRGRYIPGLGKMGSLAHAYVAHCFDVDQNPLAQYSYLL